MILVTGTTGLSGSAVIRECVGRGLPVRALVRNANKVTALGIPGTVELVEGDMLKPDTLEEALDDVERVLLISSPDQHLVETQCTFIDAAKRAGVRHIVKLSGMGCWSDSTYPVRTDARRGGTVSRGVGSGVDASAAEHIHADPPA